MGRQVDKSSITVGDADAIPHARLTVWRGQGHMAPSRYAEQVLTDLLGTLAAR